MTPKESPPGRKRTKGYTISAVADYYGVHQQTLRMYEREGLLTPSRSVGNVRLYTEEDIDRLEVILQLTRELGVNLAGVEIILHMREKMNRMQEEFNRFFALLRDYAAQNSTTQHDPSPDVALVPHHQIQTFLTRTPPPRDGLRSYEDDGSDAL
jgi:MerR family transcriptional regulator/heat shock protein HspR